MLRQWIDYIREDAVVWCAGKAWGWRLPILLYTAYVCIVHLLNPLPSDALCAPLAGLTLAVHELGHIVFIPCGEFITVAGGSIMQLLAPILLTISFLKQRDYFAISFSGGWLAFSMCNLATYIADARALQLTLVSIGGQDARHDWNYLLDATNMLSMDTTIAMYVRIGALLVFLPSIALGVWCLYRMATTRTAGFPSSV
jgi:hypothetical protein